MVICYRHGPLRTGSCALSACYAAVSAGGTDCFLIFFGGRAGYEIGSLFGDHADELLRAYTVCGTVSAAVAFITVYDNLSVLKTHCSLFADLYAGSKPHTSAFAFATQKAG